MSIDRSEKARDELATLWKKVAEAKDRERIGCRPRRCSSLVYETERIPCPHLIAEQHCNDRARPCPDSGESRPALSPQEADGRAEKQSNQPAIQYKWPESKTGQARTSGLIRSGRHEKPVHAPATNSDDDGGPRRRRRRRRWWRT
jgi:hypothetical protein